MYNNTQNNVISDVIESVLGYGEDLKQYENEKEVVLDILKNISRGGRMPEIVSGKSISVASSCGEEFILSEDDSAEIWVIIEDALKGRVQTIESEQLKLISLIQEESSL